MVISSPESLVRMPKYLKFEHAALFGSAVMTGVGAALNTSQVNLGEYVPVAGLGGVSISTNMGANAAGASLIIVVNVSEKELKFANTIGAPHKVNAKDVKEVRIVSQIYSKGVSYAIETAGVINTPNSALHITKIGGTTATAKLPLRRTKLRVDIVLLVWQEKKVAGSYMGSAVNFCDIPRNIASIQQGRLPVGKLLT